MTDQHVSSVASRVSTQLTAEVSRLLLESMGGTASPMTEIAASSRLEGDLRLDSLEFAIFGELLRTRFGDAVDLGTFLSDLDIDAVIGLTVTDVAVYVEQRGTPAQRAPQPPRSPQGES